MESAAHWPRRAPLRRGEYRIAAHFGVPCDPVTMFAGRTRLKVALALVVIAALGVGLWQARPEKRDDALPSVSAQQESLAGAPAPLAALHAQASKVLDGALDARLQTLRGYPVVINKWASWCGPCRAELPVLGRVAVSTGKQVAYLGLNAEDPNRSGAERLLVQFPQSYPSYRDPKGKQAQQLGMGSVFPTTIFIDRRGRVAYLHQGPYDTEKALRADIARYLGVSS